MWFGIRAKSIKRPPIKRPPAIKWQVLKRGRGGSSGYCFLLLLCRQLRLNAPLSISEGGGLLILGNKKVSPLEGGLGGSEILCAILCKTSHHITHLNKIISHLLNYNKLVSMINIVCLSDILQSYSATRSTVSTKPRNLGLVETVARIAL